MYLCVRECVCFFLYLYIRCVSTSVHCIGFMPLERRDGFSRVCGYMEERLIIECQNASFNFFSTTLFAGSCHDNTVRKKKEKTWRVMTPKGKTEMTPLLLTS